MGTESQKTWREGGREGEKERDSLPQQTWVPLPMVGDMVVVEVVSLGMASMVLVIAAARCWSEDMSGR